MGIGAIETLSRVHRLGRAMHPAVTLTNVKHQIILLARAVMFLPEIRKWLDTADNPLLTRALERFPLIQGAMYWPYINRDWPMQRRLSVIDRHYRMLTGAAAIVADATFEEVELARLDEEYAGLRLVLDKAVWFQREGEIVLNLFIGDQRFYSVAFTLGVEAGVPVMLVGTLQGSNSPAAQDVYREMTHMLYGMRPRDLLMAALKLLSAQLGVGRIWAVSSEHRQLRSSYFGNAYQGKEFAALDEIWLEHGGTERSNGFFEIPAIVKRKEPDEIPARKRAAYRRRYEMLDRLASDIESGCRRHAAQQPASSRWPTWPSNEAVPEHPGAAARQASAPEFFQEAKQCTNRSTD